MVDYYTRKKISPEMTVERDNFLQYALVVS